MTNEEIIAILESYKSFEDNRTEDLFHHGYDNTKASRKRKEALDEAIKALSENKGEWIPVSERLPLFGKYKLSDDVLITNGYEIDMGYLVERNGKIFWHYYGSDYEYGVKDEDNDAIAWMPLPEPYKEGGNE